MRLAATLKCPLFFSQAHWKKKKKTTNLKTKAKENLTTSEISKAINFYLMFTEAYSTAWEGI